MSYLRWDFDTEYELDPDDPLGKIYIIGDEGILKDECTMLDIFLGVIADGIQRIEPGKTIVVDPVIEPDDLIFRAMSNKLSISYGDQTVIIFDQPKFIKDLKESISKLVEIIDDLKLQAGEDKRELTELRNYIDQ
ncbi:MAG: hypothetical protein WA902_07215 [Thermosynechococcaceae cyanobacterium]